MSEKAPSSSDPKAPQGVELLQLPHPVRITQSHEGEEVEVANGVLSVQLVTVDVQSVYGSSAAEQWGSEGSSSTDIFLVLSITSSDFSLPLLATQRVEPNRQTNAYIFPSQEVPNASIILYLQNNASSSDAGALSSVSAFDDILASYCAFADDHLPEDKGKIELIDAYDGSVLGTLDLPDGVVLQEDPSLAKAKDGQEDPFSSPVDKEPVLIDLTNEAAPSYSASTSAAGGAAGGQVISVVKPISRYEDKPTSNAGGATTIAATPEGKQDWMLRGANYISQGIISGSAAIGRKMQAGADAYVEKHQGSKASSSSGTSTPIHPTALQTAATVSQYSGRVVQVSHKTAASIQRVAGHIGDRVGKATGIQRSAPTPTSAGTAPKGVRGVLNRSLVAVSSIWDSVDQSAQQLLEDGGGAAAKVIGSKYGTDAAQLSKSLGSTGKDVFLIYRDVSGVRRRALLKVAGSHLVKARTRDGQEVQVQLGQASTPRVGGASSSAAALSEKP